MLRFKSSLSKNNLIGLLICLLLFGYFFFLSIYYFVCGIETYFWEPAQAQVVGLSVIVESSAGPRGGRGYGYAPAVSYVFTLKEVTYTGNRFTNSIEIWPSKNEAGRIVGRYSIGDSLRVYYSRGEPRKSCIHRGIQKRAAIFWAIVFFVSGSILLLALKYIINRTARARLK
jgi:hypothetical protein